MKFCAPKSLPVIFKFRDPSMSLYISGIPTSVSHTVKCLGLRQSCSFNFHEQAHHQTAEAKRTATMAPRGFRNQDRKLMTFKSQFCPHLEYWLIIFMKMHKVYRTRVEKVRPASAENLIGLSSNYAKGPDARPYGMAKPN